MEKKLEEKKLLLNKLLDVMVSENQTLPETIDVFLNALFISIALSREQMHLSQRKEFLCEFKNSMIIMINAFIEDQQEGKISFYTLNNI